MGRVAGAGAGGGFADEHNLRSSDKSGCRAPLPNCLGFDQGRFGSAKTGARWLRVLARRRASCSSAWGVMLNEVKHLILVQPAESFKGIRFFASLRMTTPRPE